MKKILLLMIAMMVSVATYAQITTSGISGKVTDDKGEALIGATVIAVHTPSGSEYGAATNTEGRYTIQGMRTGGPYTVTVSYVGYQTLETTDIMLKLGEVATLNCTLAEGVDLEGIEVVSTLGSRFNNSKTGAATNFDSSAIDATPTVNRSVFDVVKTTPQASVSKDGGIVFAGASNRYNSFQVDGAIANDAFGLTETGTNGGSTGTNPISLDAIEEVQVVVAPFDVRQGGFTGGAINAITKSGTNDFKGSAYTFFNNQDFYGTTPGDVENREKLTDQTTQTYGATLGGAIVKDKLFYFVSGELYDQTYPSSWYAGADGFISKEDADRIAARYKELTGFDDNINQRDVATKSKDLLARIDWNINKDHKLMFRYQLKDAFSEDGIAGKSYATFTNSGFTRDHSTNAFVVELNSRFSDEVSNEFRATYSRIRDFRTPAVQGPTINIKNVEGVGTQVCLGTEYSSGVNQLDQDVYTITDNVSIYKGNHTITAGTHNEIYNMTNGFIQYANGAYTYSSIEDFENGIASEYYYNYSDVALTGTSRWMANFVSAQFGVYLQDEWKPNNSLSVTAGLRADLPVMFTDPTENPEFNATDVAQNGAYNIGTTPSTKVLISPRVGFRYNINERQDRLIRGGVGIFTGRVPFVWLSNIYGNTGMEMKSVAYKAYKGDEIPEFSMKPAMPEAGTPSSNVNTVAADFKFPQVFRANLAYEHTTESNWKFTLEGLYSKTLNNVMFENVAYTLAEDGVSMVGDGSVALPTYSQINKDYSSAIHLRNTNKGYTYDLSAMVQKYFDCGLMFSASYSFGHAYSVNDAGSSVAYSNWKKNPSVDNNSDSELGFSRYDIPHRINVNLNYTSPTYAKGRLNTVVGLNYQAHSGSRYNMTYNDYNKDINGDGYAGNTTLYIPTDSEIDNMVWVDATEYSTKVFRTAAESKAAFKEWCNNNPYAKEHRGEWSERYAYQSPFEHHVNLHIAENFIYNKANNSKIELSLDILNLGNMINRNWSLYYDQPYPSVDQLTVNGFSEENGIKTPKYSFCGEQVYMQDFASRWHMQIGARVTF